MEIGSDVDAGRRQGKTKGAERKPLLLAEMIGNTSRQSAARDAAEQGTASRPSRARCIEREPLTQVADRAADDNVVVAEQKPAQRRDTGRNDERAARMRFD